MKPNNQENNVSQEFHIPVLMYHTISPVAQDYNAVATEAFTEQMCWLASNRRPLTLAEAQIALQNKQVPENSVLVTFDDGYQELIEQAIPVLLKYSIPAVFFLLIEPLGGDDRWNPRSHVVRQHLYPEEVRHLANLPAMTIGAHGFTHQRITRHEAYRIVAEMAGAKAGLEELIGQQINSYAYPYGSFTPEATQLAARFFSLAFASDGLGAWNWSEDPYAIRRLNVSNHLSLEGFMRLLERGKTDCVVR